MKNLILLIGFLSLFISTSKAQTSNTLLEDDTVTAGSFDDSHPAMERSAYMLGTTGNQWLIFERRTDSLSMIAATKCLSPLGTWDTSITIITSGPKVSNAQCPDISSSRYPMGGREWIHSVAAWQQLHDGAWNIYFSTQRSDSAAWDPPAPLTNDSLGCTNAHVLAFNDSTFVLSWKRRSTLFYSFVALPPSSAMPRFTPPESLASSNDDSLEYDIELSGWNGYVVWTFKDSTGNKGFIQRQITTYPAFALAPPETLSVSGRISRPRFPSGFNYSSLFLYERTTDVRHESHLWYSSYDENISPDSSADCRNPNAFISVKIVAKTSGAAKNSAPLMLDVFTAETQRTGDSLLYIEGDFGVIDTIKGAGYNRNAAIGSLIYYLPLYHAEAVPVVWESNRNGRSHLYSRLMLVDIGEGVKETSAAINSFTLEQNFPNPFNPTTTIQFTLRSSSNVSLQIIDILGRTVETLIDKRMSAGAYGAKWDGTKHASGIYFCRLSAGSAVAVKKLILLK